MNSLFQSSPNTSRFGLVHRLAIILMILISESVLHTFVFQSVDYAGGGAARGYVQTALHALFRFSVAYVICVVIVARANQCKRGFDVSHLSGAPFRQGWALAHVTLIAILAALSFALHATVNTESYWLLSALWLLCGIGAVAAIFISLASAQRWIVALKSFRFALLRAVPPALAAVFALNLSQPLWHPAAKLTFWLVDGELGLMLPGLRSDATTQILGTDRFRVFITDACSGMEGLGLTLVFCVVILGLYRRELRFPRAFIILPAALIVMFLLNSVRIAALVLIGNAGYPEVASVGFHSQAGWILFNLVAMSVAVVARRSPWLNILPVHSDVEGASSTDAENPVAPYLAPLLSSLAVGMLSKAISAGFDQFYPATLAAAAIALGFYRRPLMALDWRYSWRAVVVGAVVFVIWILYDHTSNLSHGMPDALARLPNSARRVWIVCRAVGATATVPIVEELAFRGYLLRALTARHFELVRFRDVRWPALAGSSLIFGVIHGSMWLPGMIAGAAYGWVAIRSNTLGEAVVAHATTNALLVFAVLAYDNWQFW